ncbi:MAG TPA: 5'-nucleotidase C-terminal domain-containing protein [Bacillota bacterium]|nr:5'-nucleotidase C-terminal domain-containing protein [Bacillota bacterium]HRS21152.1 5'-nucleotidase C-terminal domain-containing protein [Clostridia bacterium]HQE67103.1 5'-nucleotidase C-terminal domain-containing protein [Bacillota bacterium]HQI15756.1 5'-nucleotidase C-terminal domain-containing protein [Bacillota bacterium]HQJ36363.1 5'-nucleotidase C-terminal domain-containing protein [Bacillota bacterium]
MNRSFKRISWLLTIVMILAMLLPMGGVWADESVNITIIHTNDTHSRLLSSSSEIGFAKIASKVKEIRGSNENVLVLDAGDTFHGQTISTIVKGESVAEVMNIMKYDAMVPGNHDFNYGQERLLELSKITNFPIIAANIIKADGSAFLSPYIIKELKGVKVGIFGLATPETTYKTNPNNVKGLTFEDPTAAAGRMVKELEGKADIIIALAHLGLDESSEYTSKLVAEKVAGIDLIIDGHSHTVLPEGLKVGDTLIVQTGEYDKNFGIVELVCENGKVTAAKSSLIAIEETEQLTEDAEVLQAIEGIKAEQSVITSEVIGRTEIELDGVRDNVRTRETNLGNLITEAILKATGADAVITNGGGIRASIDVGDITKGEVITVLPFGNYVVVKKIKGSDIVAALEHGVSQYPAPNGGFPHVAGIRFAFDPAAAAGSRITKAEIGGKALDPNAEYLLATNDFMAVGGDNYTMFAPGPVITELPGLDEIVMEYIANYGTANIKVDGRVLAEEKKAQAAVEYEVKLGDVLWKIAEKFGLTYEKLAEYNKLKDANRIYPGQRLLIPEF